MPRHVRDSTELLRDRIAHYLFVSTVAVYDRSGANTSFDESSPLWASAVPSTEVVSAATYGLLKAECDRIVQAVCGDRATIVRPSFIFGPGDDTDRFTYWVDRVARGGEALGPPDPAVELQWMDVRDLCPWIVELARGEPGGIFNAAGPASPTTWGQVLQELTRLAAQPTSLRWSTVELLRQSGIELPLVRTGSASHFVNTAALAAGLDLRSLADTAAAALDATPLG